MRIFKKMNPANILIEKFTIVALGKLEDERLLALCSELTNEFKIFETLENDMKSENALFLEKLSGEFEKRDFSEEPQKQKIVDLLVSKIKFYNNEEIFDPFMQEVKVENEN